MSPIPRVPLHLIQASLLRESALRNTNYALKEMKVEDKLTPTFGALASAGVPIVTASLRGLDSPILKHITNCLSASA